MSDLIRGGSRRDVGGADALAGSDDGEYGGEGCGEDQQATTAGGRRAILDAGGRRPTLLAETTEPLGERDGPSAGARNLLRTSFRQASVRPTWRRG